MTRKKSVTPKKKPCCTECEPLVGWIYPKCGAGLAPWVTSCGCNIVWNLTPSSWPVYPIVVNPPAIPVPTIVPYYPYNIPSTGDPLPIPNYTVCCGT